MTPIAQPRFPARPARRLTIFLGVRDRHRHGSLEMELLKRARKAKLAGATVFEGELGFGSAGHLHREHLVSDDRPLAIVVVDAPERIDAFVAELGTTARGVVITIEDVEIIEI